MALHVRTSKKPRKLTKAEREAVNAKPEQNAGAGWSKSGTNPIAWEEGWGRKQ